MNCYHKHTRIAGKEQKRNKDREKKWKKKNDITRKASEWTPIRRTSRGDPRNTWRRTTEMMII